MTSSHVRRAACGLAAVLALAAVPSAQATPSLPVCNQASPHFQGGGLVARPAGRQPAARYTDDLYRLPGNGEGLVNAASHSPALTICGEGDGSTGGPGGHGGEPPPVRATDS